MRQGYIDSQGNKYILTGVKAQFPRWTYAEWQAEGEPDIPWIRTDAPSGYRKVSGNDVSYDNTSSGLSATEVNGAIDEVYGKLGGVRTFLINKTTSESQTYDIDISSYDELYVELRYYSTPFSVINYKDIHSGTYRIYGFVDYTSNFASCSIEISQSLHITSVSIPNFVGAGTSVAIYGVKY